MVQKSLRKKLLIDSFNRNYDPNNNNNNKISEYLYGKEEKLVRAKIISDNGFSWKIYRGLDDEFHKFIGYDFDGSITEYLVHQNDLRIDHENLVMNNPNVKKYSIHSELGMKEMDIINKSGFMELTSI